MKLTDLITPELYRRWHQERREIPGLLKQRQQRLEPLRKEFANCILNCSRPRELDLILPREIELFIIENALLSLDQMIEMATEPRGGTN
jgi:hypothetical protein